MRTAPPTFSNHVFSEHVFSEHSTRRSSAARGIELLIYFYLLSPNGATPWMRSLPPFFFPLGLRGIHTISVDFAAHSSHLFCKKYRGVRKGAIFAIAPVMAVSSLVSLSYGCLVSRSG